MLLVVCAFAALALATPLLTRWWGTRVFSVVAILPAAAFVYTLTQSATVIAGGEYTESVPWIPQLGIALSFRVDALSWLLALIVTGVGALVLLYCASYFSPSEPALGRFASILLLFAGIMYGLVTSDDVVVMFIFWEATSVLSYLLIGHYTSRKESRGAAIQALLVTTFGGLAMLVGVAILVVQAGSTSLAVIVATPLHGPIISTAIILVIVGAGSKSALVPFHFWLPAAMEAPTPVSAYLHAAAMVKAGIYLIARLAPGFADTPGWRETLITVGLITMLVGGWRSLRQNDLKLVLAYGTISQLGFLALIAGYGSRDSALAAASLLVAHTLYKAALFLTVGIIEHRTGTRDLRRLSGLRRSQPVLAVIALVSVASMAGVPPFFGFVAKEAAFTALFDSGGSGDAWGWIALVGIVVGSVITFAYSARFLWGAFAVKRETAATPVTHPDNGVILIAPGILALFTVAAGLASPWLDHALSAYADTLGTGDYHLALWHGIEPALVLTALVVMVGAVVVWQRIRVTRFQATVPPWINASGAYWQIIRYIDSFSHAITVRVQRFGLPGYIAAVLGVFIAAVGAATIMNRTWPNEVTLWDYPAQVFIAVAMIIAALCAARATQRIAAVLLVGVTGYGMVTLFAVQGAPDLALTQALVETITLVVFVLVLRRLPSDMITRHRPRHQVFKALVATTAGGVLGIAGFIALGARQHESVSERMPELALEAHGHNVVNVMLVDIRAWDTMGEIAVLVVVATGIASLIFVNKRTGGAPQLPQARPTRQLRNRRAIVLEPDTRSATVLNGDSSTLLPDPDAPTRGAFLIAGRTLSARNRSILVEVLTRLLFHPAIVLSLYLLFVGHNMPGGGFAGGLVAGLALVTRYLAGGRYELGEALGIDAGRILGTGILLATGTALLGLFLGGEVLQSTWFQQDLGWVGEISIGTTTLFDIGVYLVVVGLILDVLRSLGAEIDRHLDEGVQANDTLTDSPAEANR
ncbi:Na+/H+ antiporter subunit A [Klugiella xanthotipulae]|uniref:Multisubunit sodium/proton antiporter MrpA subunit /multisubunit sodium/proton antiporter MrpB subunit n=1 Tax=Klugiella xanthotipulae TaxID=244735 RepID=A0A543I4Q5_9MICO|nr:Na+/H+ antiporter subunit A [Klugiella xanthotipulae]TQM65583.1 multisubunit sodium/proton antiporter MrpA subunit /multisubunit sodium/proton antiporter MrpB subunit [Klugiella xanthotipulae]